MAILAKSHWETKFVKLNAEKAPYICEKLKIWMLPTLALCKNGKVEDYIVGLDELGGTESFSTADLENAIAARGVMYTDDAENSVRINGNSYSTDEPSGQ